MSETPSQRNLDLSFWHRTAIVSAVVLVALLPFGYPFSWNLAKSQLHIGGFRAAGFFYVLALLPGLAAIVDHVFRTPTRRWDRKQAIERYNTSRGWSTGDGTIGTGAGTSTMIGIGTSGAPRPATFTGTGDGKSQPSQFTTGTAAAIFLTAVFLLVAAFADRMLDKVPPSPLRPAHGIIFCGFGAYVSVLYYLGARMYANAISTSFLMTSALRSASAIAFGYAAVAIGVNNILPSGATQIGALFMSGLFYSWALASVRAKAMTWFGAPKTDNEELPLGIIEGVDDTTADQLNEYSITTIQHLAETDPAELCERTLLPLDRVVSWVNQAILITEVKRNIVAFRAAGKGTATKVARCYALAQAKNETEAKVLESIAAKSGLGKEVLDSIAGALLTNTKVKQMYKYLENESLDAPRPNLQTLVRDELNLYTVVDGKLTIREQSA